MIIIKQGHRYHTNDGDVIAMEDRKFKDQYDAELVRCLDIKTHQINFTWAGHMRQAPMRYFHGEIPK